MNLTVDNLELLLDALCTLEHATQHRAAKNHQFASFLEANKAHASIHAPKGVDVTVEDMVEKIHTETDAASHELIDRITMLKADLVKERRRKLGQEKVALVHEASDALLSMLEPPDEMSMPDEPEG